MLGRVYPVTATVLTASTINCLNRTLGRYNRVISRMFAIVAKNYVGEYEMTDQPIHARRELRWARCFGGILAGVGLFTLLHGGLSLMGGFGLERRIIEHAGRTPPTERRMWVEVLAGTALLSGGLAVYIKSGRHQIEHDKALNTDGSEAGAG